MYEKLQFLIRNPFADWYFKERAARGIQEAVRTLLTNEEDTALLKAEHGIPLREEEQRYLKSAIRKLSNY
jgi:hypothetical protein